MLVNQLKVKVRTDIEKYHSAASLRYPKMYAAGVGTLIHSKLLPEDWL